MENGEDSISSNVDRLEEGTHEHFPFDEFGTPMLTPYNSVSTAPDQPPDARRATVEQEFEAGMMSFIREIQQQSLENYALQHSGYESGNEFEDHAQQPSEATDESDGAILLSKEPVSNGFGESLHAQRCPDVVSSFIEEHPSPSEVSSDVDSACMSTFTTEPSPLISRQSLCVPYTDDLDDDDDKLISKETLTTLIVDYPEIKKDKKELGHIMISYNHSTRTMCLKIAQALRNLDYQVWIDQDNISGDILTSMASAVENAFVVLMAISEKYHQSRYCRLEAEYAMEQNKPSIPMLMQSGYKASGWLGLLNGSKFQIDFSSLTFDEAFPILIREIEAIRISLGGEKKDQTANSSTRFDSHHHLTTMAEHSCSFPRNVHEWNADHVIDWLDRVKLAIFQPVLTNFTGETLWQLYKIRLESPTDYHRTIDTLLSAETPLRLFYNLTFNSALESLFSSSISSKY